MTENFSNRIVPSWNHGILYLMLLSYYIFVVFPPRKEQRFTGVKRAVDSESPCEAPKMLSIPCWSHLISPQP